MIVLFSLVVYSARLSIQSNKSYIYPKKNTVPFWCCVLWKFIGYLTAREPITKAIYEYTWMINKYENREFIFNKLKYYGFYTFWQAKMSETICWKCPYCFCQSALFVNFGVTTIFDQVSRHKWHWKMMNIWLCAFMCYTDNVFRYTPCCHTIDSHKRPSCARNTIIIEYHSI